MKSYVAPSFSCGIMSGKFPAYLTPICNLNQLKSSFILFAFQQPIVCLYINMSHCYTYGLGSQAARCRDHFLCRARCSEVEHRVDRDSCNVHNANCNDVHRKTAISISRWLLVALGRVPYFVSTSAESSFSVI